MRLLLFEGYPVQNKIGDYITIVSDNTGGDVAFPATYNFNPGTGQHEQDVYFVRVAPGRQPNTDAYCYAYTDRYGHAELYSNSYAKANAHASVGSHTKAASHTAPKADAWPAIRDLQAQG